MSIPFPKRTVHLDFHTGPDIADVGAEFDPEGFAEIIADAHIDSVTLFAKCHHGHLYYDTDRPERHPGLSADLNLLEAQIDALKSRGIRAPIYLTVQCDEYAANMHPEWCAVDPEGRQVKHGGPFEAAWQILDMSGPYQDFLAEQLAEVLDKFAPTDGIFMDLCWDQPSCSKWAIDGMRKRNYNPENPVDRARYAREVVHQYMGRYKEMIDAAHEDGGPVGVWFNSRPKAQLFEEKKYLRHIEVECLPTGGWGYAYFPYVARMVRPMDMPTLSHTARFHRSWGDFGGLKPEAAMKYECCSILAQGMTNGVGDQLHPRGTLDQAAYQQIGQIYAYIRSCEPWLEGGRLLSEIGVLIDPEQGDQPGAVGLGVVRALQELRCQFDLIPPDSELEKYKLIVVPENIAAEPVLADKIRTYLQNGGALLAAGEGSLTRGGALLQDLGVDVQAPSPYTAVYLRPKADLVDALPPTDHVFYERTVRMKATGSGEKLVGVVEPYFERTWEHFCSHNQTPPAEETDYAFAVRNGRTVAVAGPIFTAYGKHGNLPYREILRACLRKLLPDPLILDEGPAHMEVSVVETPERRVVHVLSFYPQNRTTTGLEIIEDAFPLVNVPMSIRCEKEPSRVYLAPEKADLPFEYKDGRVHVSLTCLTGHTMIVLE